MLFNFNRNKCSFGGEIVVRDELIFFSDMPGNRVHVIDVKKGQVNISLVQWNPSYGHLVNMLTLLVITATLFCPGETLIHFLIRKLP